MKVCGWALFKKDLLVELRTQESLWISLLFALLLTVIGSFCFPTTNNLAQLWIPGLYWLIYIFASTIILTNAFRQEQSEGSLQAFLLAGVSAETLLLSKALYQWLLISMIGLILWPLFAVFYQVPIAAKLPRLILILLLTGIGFALLGTFCAAMLRASPLRQIFMPLVFFPLILPLVIPAIYATQSVLADQPVRGLEVILSFDLLFGALAYMLFAHLVEG